jgi:hypothetical protein
MSRNLDTTPAAKVMGAQVRFREAAADLEMAARTYANALMKRPAGALFILRKAADEYAAARQELEAALSDLKEEI